MKPASLSGKFAAARRLLCDRSIFFAQYSSLMRIIILTNIYLAGTGWCFLLPVPAEIVTDGRLTRLRFSSFHVRGRKPG